MDRRRIGTALRVSQYVIDVLNELIRFEDQRDHADAIAEVVKALGGRADTCRGLASDGEMTERYELALARDLPPIALEVIRRNLEDERASSPRNPTTATPSHRRSSW